MSRSTSRPADPADVPVKAAAVVARALAELGVGAAFGVTGGACAEVFAGLSAAGFPVVHCRHEGGAAFAAVEFGFASGAPSVVFTTTGPGLTNALTGILAGRREGARLVVLSAMTSPADRGRGTVQESSLDTMPMDLYRAGPVFDHVTVVEHPAQLATALARIAEGLRRPSGFVAHLAMPSTAQASRVPPPRRSPGAPRWPVVSAETTAMVQRRLAGGRFVIWVGFGARHAGPEIVALAERTGADVMCSPRAKGVFPEDHPRYLGVTGLAGHDSVTEAFARRRPERVLVLGTRLGEATSYWESELVPGELIQVDLDPTAFSAAYPSALTLGVLAEIKDFLTRLLPGLPPGTADPDPVGPRRPAPPTNRVGPVRAAVLMAAVQRRVIDATDALVLAESGNAFAWATNLLRFREPRYRVSVGFGSMGQATAGVLGAAIGRRGKAVALVGDGAMLMNHEVSTAVAVGAPAVWIVLNDSAYGMVAHGMRELGLDCPPMDIPDTDFALLARAVGADGERVTGEAGLDAALSRAMAAPGPYVVDVRTDPGEAGPWIKRIQSLILQARESGAAR